MAEQHTLTGLQLAMLRILWDRGEATVAEMWEAMHDERGLAPTTLATMLTRLERKGVVTHRTQARQFVYRALVSEQEVKHSMVSELTGRLFEGDVSALVSHLLTAQDVSPGDRERIRAMLHAATLTEKKQ
jgi:BlaI family transcriptional regulator, penicillinase repressor